MHNTSKSNKKGEKCDTSRTRPKAIFVVYASSLSCLVSRRLAPTALKTFFLLWQKWKWKKQLLAIFNVKHFCFLRGQIQSKLFDWKNLLVNYRTVNWFWSNFANRYCIIAPDSRRMRPLCSKTGTFPKELILCSHYNYISAVQLIMGNIQCVLVFSQWLIWAPGNAFVAIGRTRAADAAQPRDHEGEHRCRTRQRDHFERAHGNAILFSVRIFSRWPVNFS